MLALSPSTAQADWLFAPSAAYPFAGDTLGGIAPAFAFGLGWLDEESVGLEAEVGYAPRFFDADGDFTGTGSVFSLMGNLMIGGSSTGRVMPYVTGGAGYLRMQVTSDEGRFTSSTVEPGFNAGAGIIGFLRDGIGLRGDVRYFRSFRDLPPSWTRGVAIDIAPGNFDFWRASIGVTIRVRD